VRDDHILPGEEDDDADDFAPGDPDYDLSEAHGYMWEPERAHWPISPGALTVISIIVVIALVLPTLLFVLSNR
jgi:hypothetical protein